LTGSDYGELSARVEQAVRDLGGAS
jgi:hypothetical protein